MNDHEALVAVAVVVTVGVIAVVALLIGREVRMGINHETGRFELHTKARGAPAESSSGSPEKPGRASKSTRPWMSRHWRFVTSASLILIIILAPACWWFAQREVWRMLVSEQLREALNALLQGSDKPLESNTGEETLNKLARVMKVHIAKLEGNVHHREEIWVVDHHWQFWLSELFDEYRTLNRDFVHQGGRIHRLFVFDEKDLHDPKLDKMLRGQCDIALNSGVTSSDLELWLAHPDIKSSEPYKQVAEQFESVYGKTAAFEQFDALQFEDAFYFSNSFDSAGESDSAQTREILGSSTWIFDPAQMGKIHLEILFTAKNPIAEPFRCDHFQQSFKAATGRDPAVR